MTKNLILFVFLISGVLMSNQVLAQTKVIEKQFNLTL